MIYKEVDLKTLNIVGISIRTNNKITQSQGDIAKLWSTFFENQIISKIEHRLSDDIYCIYTNYESDYTGDYTTILGCLVSKADLLPEGLESTTIDAQKYYKFVSEGKMPECVLKTWTHIWDNDYQRAYKSDFDIYGAEAKDPNDAKITTYLSIT